MSIISMLRAVIIQNEEKIEKDCEEQKKHKYKMVTKNLKERTKWR